MEKSKRNCRRTMRKRVEKSRRNCRRTIRKRITTKRRSKCSNGVKDGAKRERESKRDRHTDTERD